MTRGTNPSLFCRSSALTLPRTGRTTPGSGLTSHTGAFSAQIPSRARVQLLGSGDSEAHARTGLVDACSRLPEEKLKSIIYRHVAARQGISGHDAYFTLNVLFELTHLN